MKRIITSLIVFFFIGMHLYGQDPAWTVNENDFEYTMSFVAFINIDGTTLASTNDKVAAFVGDECRGVANLIYVASKDRYYAYFNVFANTNGETLSFKVYDSTNDTVVAIDKTADFQINELLGDLNNAYSFSNGTLNSEAELLSFNFKGVTIINRSVIGNIMTLYVDNGLDLATLTPVFELSEGAILKSNGVALTSGSSVLDFTSTVVVEVVLQEEATGNQWEIKVVYNTAIGNLVFYKKEAVCHTGGVIKVMSTQSGTTVLLLKDEVDYASQVLTNGEAIFNNLDAGNYLVNVNGFEKIIVINVKE